MHKMDGGSERHSNLPRSRSGTHTSGRRLNDSINVQIAIVDSRPGVSAHVHASVKMAGTGQDRAFKDEEAHCNRPDVKVAASFSPET